MRLLAAFLLTLASSWIASGQTYTISTFAGGYLAANVRATSAELDRPSKCAADQAGDVFVSDNYAHVVWRIDAATGFLTIVAGTGSAGFSGDGGPATGAQLNSPLGIAVDSSGSLYIADYGNNRIRKITNGVITTVAGSGTAGFGGDGGPATNAALNGPYAVALDSASNMYIADLNNNRIRKVANRVITTVAGNGTAGFSGDSGTATGAQLNQPAGVAVDSGGNLYISDQFNNRIRKVANGLITTVAGNGTAGYSGDNGPATSAELNGPYGVFADSSDNLYIADRINNRVRKVSNGVITTAAGSNGYGFSGDGGPATSAYLSYVRDVAVDTANNLYIADAEFNRRIRKVSSNVITTLAGNDLVGDAGSAASALLGTPQFVAVDPSGNLYIAETRDYRVRKVSNGTISTAAGVGANGYSPDGVLATIAGLEPYGTAADSFGNLYVADTNYNRVLKVSNGVIATVAGNGTYGYSGDNGPATGAQLGEPLDVAVDSAGSLYIADTYNHRIRKVTNGVITTVAGDGQEGFGGDNGPASSAQLNYPQHIAVDSSGNLYIADTDNNRIRKVANGVIATVAGDGSSVYSGDGGLATSAGLPYPAGVAVDSLGNLYVADTGDNRIRKISNGVIATVAGSGTQGFSGDGGAATSAALDQPMGVAVDSIGNVYIADYGNNRVRIMSPSNAVPTITQNGVVPIFSPVPVIQSGSWVSIYGTNLAAGTSTWNGDFPTSLGGVTVTIDNKPAYLWLVSPTQINLQVPDDTTTGMVSVVVNTGFGTAASTVTLAPYGPSFSLLGDGKHVAGEIATPNGAGTYGGGTYDLVGPSGAFSFNTRPVKAGETLILYGVGFGPTTPQVPAGKAFSGAALTSSPVTITIGGVNANVAFSGVTEAGLYQFNLTVPANTGSGDQTLQATVNGVQTPLGPVVTVQ